MILRQLLLYTVLGLSASSYAYEQLATEGSRDATTMISGKISQTMDVSGYTYAEVDTGKEKVWAAGPVTRLRKGEYVSFSAAMPVEKYHSKSLNRDFSIIYFVGGFYAANGKAMGADVDMATPHGGRSEKPVVSMLKGIEKLKDGNSIAEIYAQKSALKDKSVRVRGKVIKFSAAIMGKNWLHIRDSSSLQDLTLTSNAVASPGEIIVVEGKLGLEKDFGYGYIYPVILEDAVITK